MRVRPASFDVGDWVFVYCPRRRQGRSAKWTKYYSAPMLITKVLGPVNYLVQRSARAKAQVVHVDKLKRCEGVKPVSWLPAMNSSADDDNEPEPGPAEAATTDPSHVGGGPPDPGEFEPERGWRSEVPGQVGQPQ